MDNEFKSLYYYDLVTILLGRVFTGLAKTSIYLDTNFCGVALSRLLNWRSGENIEIWSLTKLSKWFLSTNINWRPDFPHEEISNSQSIRPLYSSR